MKQPLTLLLLALFLPAAALGQQLQLQFGHTDRVSSVAFSPDGNAVITGSYDGTVKRWDLKGIETATFRIPQTVTGMSVADFLGGGGGAPQTTESRIVLPALHAEYSPNGQYLLATTPDKAVVFHAQSQQVLREINAAGMAGAATFLPGSQGILCGNVIQSPMVYDLEGKQAGYYPAQGAVALAYSPDGKAVAVGSPMTGLVLFNAANAAILKSFNVRVDPVVNTLGFDKAGERVVLANRFGVAVCQIADGKVLALPPIDGTPRAAAYNSDGSLLLVAHGQYLSAFNRQHERLWSKHAGGEVHALAASPADPKLFAIGLESGLASLWTAEGAQITEYRGYAAQWIGIGLSADGTKLALAGRDGFAKIWDLATNAITAVPHGGTITCMAVSPQGKYFATGGEDNAAVVWDWTGKRVSRHVADQGENSFTDLRTGLTSLAFTGSEQYLLTGSVKRKALFWQVGADKAPVQEIPSTGDAHTATSVQAVALSPDGKYYFVAREPNTYNPNDGLAVWNGQGTHLRSFGAYDVRQLALVNNGEKVLAACGDGLKLFATETGALEAVLAEGRAWSAAASADGAWLAGGLSDGRIALRGPNGQVRYLEGHTARVTGLVFDAKATRLFSASEDGTVRLWKLDVGKTVARLVPQSGTSGDYAVLLPNNHYGASKNGVAGINFSFGGRMYPFEQFDLKFNRPHEAYGAMGYMPASTLQAIERAHEKRFKRLGLDPGQTNADIVLPSMGISQKAYVSVNATGRFPIGADVDGRGRVLASYNLFVNGVPLYGAAGKAVNGNTASLQETVMLTPGVNRIQIAFSNAQGDKVIEERVVYYSQPSAPKPMLHLFVIGISKFAASEHNLRYPVKDAQDVAALFMAQQGKQFSRVAVHTLLDEQVTKENIRALRAKMESTGLNDMVVVYYSGHGLLGPKQDYFLSTYAVNFQQPAEQGMPYEELEAMLDGIPARKKVLLLDACHSGEVDKEGAAEELAANTTEVDLDGLSFKGTAGVQVGNQSTFELMGLLFADLRSNIGANVIAAAAGAQYALEDHAWQNGAFTYCLRQGLADGKADLNGDGIVQLSELQAYVYEAVSQLTGGKQRPTSRAENRAYDFKIWE